MAHYLLTSEQFIKSNTPISSNIAGKYILSALLDAQEVRLKGIVGSAMLESLKAMCKKGTIEDNELYKGLLDRVQMALAWMVVAKLARDLSYKLTNKGVVTTSDEGVANATFEEVIVRGADAQASADHYVADVQRYLMSNRSQFPELADNDCWRIKSNLTSSASCALWLGGLRGKKMSVR